MPAPAGAPAAAPLDDATFVLTARRVVVGDDVLDLVDLTPSTICVTWSRTPAVTYLTTGQLLDLWASPERGSAPARVELLHPSPEGEDPVLVHVRSPRIVGSGLRWTLLQVLGRLPRRSGACVLVINPPEASMTLDHPHR